MNLSKCCGECCIVSLSELHCVLVLNLIITFTNFIITIMKIVIFFINYYCCY